MTRLPDGFTIRLRANLVRADGGQVLVGGSPARVMKLSVAAHRALASGTLTVTGDGSAALARRLLDANLADPVLPAPPPPVGARAERTPGTDAEAGQLTVVVPVKDRSDELDRCLAALAPLPRIVVDDGSEHPDRVAEVARRHGARLVVLPHNRGPAAARNAGLEVARTPFVAFVDSDVTTSPADLEALARHFADPQVALVAPRVVGQARTLRPRWFERYDEVASSLDVGPHPGLVRPGSAVGWVPSACLLGRTAVLRAIGGFDTGWRVGEDVDLVWRLIGDGHQVRYDPSVRASHDVRGTARGWLGRTFVYGTSGAALAARHGDQVAPAILSVPMAIGAAAVLQRRWWSLPVAAAAVAAQVLPMRRSLPLTQDADRVSALLGTRALGWAVRQESGLLLRHWWPVTAALAPFSRPVRRAALSALAVDTLVHHLEHEPLAPHIVLPARRLTDLAYGAGLWCSAIAARSPAALKIRWVAPARRRRG